MNRDRKVKVEGDSLYFLDESGWHVGFTVWGLA